MSSKTAIMVASSALLVLALGVGWYGHQSAREAEAALRALTQKRARMDASVRQAEERIAQRETEAGAIEAKLKTLQSAKPSQPAAAATSRLPSKDPATLIASSPPLRDLYLRSLRANLAMRFGSMYQSLGLSQAQIDKFEELATAHAEDRETSRAAALAQGLSLSSPGYVALQKQNVDQFYAAVASEVGADVSQKVIQLDRMQGIQAIVNDVDSMIAPGSPPLTFAQAARLSEVLASSNPADQNGGHAESNKIDWDYVNAQAGAIVSGAQLQALVAEAQMSKIFDKVKLYYQQQQGGK